MKLLGCFTLLMAPIVLVGFFAWVTMYVVVSLMAGESVRQSPVIPGAMGQIAGDKIDAWVLGNYEPRTIDNYNPPPWANAEPDNDGSVEVGNEYTGTVPTRDDCKVPYGWPIDGPVSQEFSSAHSGIDIVGSEGEAIMTTMCGTVVYAGWNDQGYGNLVIVENGEYKTYYAHQEEVYVTLGQQVEIGEVLGTEGNTGNTRGANGGYHVHYEVRLNGVPQNPRNYMD